MTSAVGGGGSEEASEGGGELSVMPVDAHEPSSESELSIVESKTMTELLAVLLDSSESEPSDGFREVEEEKSIKMDESRQLDVSTQERSGLAETNHTKETKRRRRRSDTSRNDDWS